MQQSLLVLTCELWSVWRPVIACCNSRRIREQVDIVLDDSSCSRVHAALVHHSDGRLFVIDLQSVRRR
jgi:hypothetical protein